jgi:hypothetical protein
LDIQLISALVLSTLTFASIYKNYTALRDLPEFAPAGDALVTYGCGYQRVSSMEPWMVCLDVALFLLPDSSYFPARECAASHWDRRAAAARQGSRVTGDLRELL